MNSSAAQMIEGQLISVPAGSVTLNGNLTMPEDARAVVLFAHGSGSSRHSPRNRYVARVLNEAKLATLLIDLLTVHEEVVDARTAHLRFDIDLLAERARRYNRLAHPVPRYQELSDRLFRRQHRGRSRAGGRSDPPRSSRGSCFARRPTGSGRCGLDARSGSNAIDRWRRRQASP